MPNFDFGNKVAEKYDEEAAIEAFKRVFEQANKRITYKEDGSVDYENGPPLCLQEAVIMGGMAPSTYFYLVNKFPVLEPIKKDTMDALISTMNRLAVTFKAQPAAAIFRMKQLGERDEQVIHNTGSGSVPISKWITDNSDKEE